MRVYPLIEHVNLINKLKSYPLLKEGVSIGLNFLVMKQPICRNLGASLSTFLTLSLLLSTFYTSVSQTYFSKVQTCDTCLTSFYGDAIFDHNQQLIVSGMQHNSNTTFLFLDQYTNNSSNYTRHFYVDTNYYIGLQLLQNDNKSYYVFCCSQQDTGSNFNGIHTNYLFKIDTNFNLLSKSILNQTSYFNSDIYRKVKRIGQKFYCIGEHKDSLNSNQTLKSIGLSIYDTSSNLLSRKFLHIFPNQYVRIFDVVLNNNFFYITGYHFTDPMDPCSVYYDGFLVKIDTLGNLIWSHNFTSLFENTPKGININSQNNLLFTGFKQPDCSLPNSIYIQENKVFTTNNDSINNSVYGDTTTYQIGQFVVPRSNTTMMLMCNRSPSSGYFKDFIFQIASNDGQVLYEANHSIPDSCLLEDFNNQFNCMLQNPNTNGYTLLGQVSRKSNITGINYATQAWIINADSNGCIVPGCAIPMNTSYTNNLTRLANIFPNPSTNGIYSIQSSLKIDRWKIYNLNSILIAQGNDNIINITHEPAGIYVLQLFTKENISTIKLIRQ